VQAGRLRSKLAEYYAGEGAEDPFVIELPKGAYLLSVHPRAAEVAAEPERVGASRALWSWPMPILSALLVMAVIVIGWQAAVRKRVEIASAADRDAAPAALQAFWKPFLWSEEPWIVFSNAAFVGRPETGMRYYNSAQDSGGVLWDHYTGVGEVLAVHNLDQAFALLHSRVRVKRGSLFTLDDFKNNNLIFVGSPSENLTLLDIPTTQEFVFQRVATGPRKGDLAIVDRHPQPGNPSEFLASPSGALLTEDYSVIGLFSGLDPKRSVLILAGTTTFGTQAAAEYVSRQNSVEELLSKLSGSGGGQVQPFEALLRVKIARGVPVETHLVAVRKR
jgi:hypothetical protein